VLHVRGIHGRHKIFEEGLSGNFPLAVPDFIYHVLELLLAQFLYSFALAMET